MKKNNVRRKLERVLAYFAFVLFIIACAQFASAELDVKVNGVEAGSSPLYTEIGDELNIQVLLKSSSDVEDVKVSAWIGGYEYGLLEDASEAIDLESGVAKLINLKIILPRDMNLEDNDYSLVVEAAGKQYYESKEYMLYIREPRHAVEIEDVMVNPSGEIVPGSAIMIKTRVKNNGYKIERGIKIDASIPSLGINSREWINLLEARGGDDCGDAVLYLRIPKNAEEGMHTLVVQAVYDNGRKKDEFNVRLKIAGSEPESTGDSSTLASIIVPKGEVKVGEMAVITLQIANIGEQRKTYFIEAVGNVDVSEPLMLDENEAGEMHVYFTPLGEGRHAIKINLKTKGAKVASYNVVVNAHKANDSWVWIGSILLILSAMAVVVLARHIDAKEYPKI